MARSHPGTKPLKKFSLTQAEIDDAQLAADRETGGSVSALGREIILSFIENGTDYSKPNDGIMQIVMDPDALARAEEKARVGYGASLREVFRHELAKRTAKARRARR